MLIVLVGEDDKPCAGFHQLHRRAELDIEANAGWCIHLGKDRHLGTFDDAHVARLLRLMSDPMHHRESLGYEPLGGRVLLHQLEELECECISLVLYLGDVAPALQAEKHTKDLRHRPLELTRYLAFGEPARLMCKQLDDIEAL